MDSLRALRLFFGEIARSGVQISLKALFQMRGEFAECERSIIRERIETGLKRARTNGK